MVSEQSERAVSRKTLLVTSVDLEVSKSSILAIAVSNERAVKVRG